MIFFDKKNQRHTLRCQLFVENEVSHVLQIVGWRLYSHKVGRKRAIRTNTRKRIQFGPHIAGECVLISRFILCRRRDAKLLRGRTLLFMA